MLPVLRWVRRILQSADAGEDLDTEVYIGITCRINVNQGSNTAARYVNYVGDHPLAASYTGPLVEVDGRWVVATSRTY